MYGCPSEGLTEADVAISNGDLAGYIDKLTDKLPSGVNTLAKNVAITKDTALFQGLNRALQYGDFLAGSPALFPAGLVFRRRLAGTGVTSF